MLGPVEIIIIMAIFFGIFLKAYIALDERGLKKDKDIERRVDERGLKKDKREGRSLKNTVGFSKTVVG